MQKHWLCLLFFLLFFVGVTSTVCPLPEGPSRKNAQTQRARRCNIAAPHEFGPTNARTLTTRFSAMRARNNAPFGNICFYSPNRNYYKGVDLAMNTTTRNMLAVPVIDRSLGNNEGKVIAVRSSVDWAMRRLVFVIYLDTAGL